MIVSLVHKNASYEHDTTGQKLLSNEQVCLRCEENVSTLKAFGHNNLSGLE